MFSSPSLAFISFFESRSKYVVAKREVVAGRAPVPQKSSNDEHATRAEAKQEEYSITKAKDDAPKRGKKRRRRRPPPAADVPGDTLLPRRLVGVPILDNKRLGRRWKSTAKIWGCTVQRRPPPRPPRGRVRPIHAGRPAVLLPRLRQPFRRRGVLGVPQVPPADRSAAAPDQGLRLPVQHHAQPQPRRHNELRQPADAAPHLVRLRDKRPARGHEGLSVLRRVQAEQRLRRPHEPVQAAHTAGERRVHVPQVRRPGVLVRSKEGIGWVRRGGRQGVGRVGLR